MFAVVISSHIYYVSLDLHAFYYCRQTSSTVTNKFNCNSYIDRYIKQEYAAMNKN